MCEYLGSHTLIKLSNNWQTVEKNSVHFPEIIPLSKYSYFRHVKKGVTIWVSVTMWKVTIMSEFGVTRFLKL